MQMCFGTCCSFHSLSTLSPQIFTHSLTHSLTHSQEHQGQFSVLKSILPLLPPHLPAQRMGLFSDGTHKTLHLQDSPSMRSPSYLYQSYLPSSLSAFFSLDPTDACTLLLPPFLMWTCVLFLPSSVCLVGS
jgi:hypothetical protein